MNKVPEIKPSSFSSVVQISAALLSLFGLALSLGYDAGKK